MEYKGVPRPESETENKNEGKLLIKYLEFLAGYSEAETDHPLFQFNRTKVELMATIDSLVIVGPSASGKSTAVDLAREWTESATSSVNFVVPKRIISRPRRLNDNLEENEFAATDEEFRAMTEGGITWQRRMDKQGARVEYYGFPPVPDGSFPFYSTNDAFLDDTAKLRGVPPGFHSSAFILLIYAREHVRAQRLSRRSPDIVEGKPEEAAMRLAPIDEALFRKSHSSLRTRSLEREKDIMDTTIKGLLTGIKEIKES